MANPTRPRDPNQRAKLIVEIATAPAMAAGVADHVWTLNEIAALLD